MEKRPQNNCQQCSHELIHGVACDWQPDNCCLHKMRTRHAEACSHKHSAWAVNFAEENEYDAVRSFG